MPCSGIPRSAIPDSIGKAGWEKDMHPKYVNLPIIPSECKLVLNSRAWPEFSSPGHPTNLVEPSSLKCTRSFRLKMTRHCRHLFPIQQPTSILMGLMIPIILRIGGGLKSKPQAQISQRSGYPQKQTDRNLHTDFSTLF